MNKVLKLVSVCALVLFLSASAFAQTKVTATLLDSTNGEPIGFATAYLTKAGQTAPAKYTLSSIEGKVELDNVKKGTYVFSAELMGYKSYTKEITVENASIDLGEVKMEPDLEVLDAASVSATGNAIIIKKDTVEYNASSFKTTENDVLEDLLKKLPGVEVSEDGSITWNGETIDKITLNGKTFFLNDPQLASKNLPAKMVDKLKVIEKKTDQAEFSGIDDGEREYVIDLGIKKNMMNGSFGNAMAGAGRDIPSTAVNGDTRYQAAAFAGNFTDDVQLSVILNGNNTNNRGFNDLSGSMMGGMMGGGGMMGRGQGGWGGRNGITTSYMGGLNGAWTLFDDKMELGANYVYNFTDNDVEESKIKNTYLDDRTLNYYSQGISNTRSGGHRIGMRLEHEFSKTSNLIFEPQINFGTGSYMQDSKDSTYQDGTTKLNRAYTNNTGDNKNFSASGFLLYRQRLGKAGRTLTAMTRLAYSNNELEGINNNGTVNYDADGHETADGTIVRQSFDNSQNSSSAWARATYTEPITDHIFVEANYSYNWSRSTSDKNTIDILTGLRAEDYSNNIENIHQSQEMGAAVMYQTESSRAQVGFNAIPTNTYNSTTSHGNVVKYEDHRWKFAPSAMVWWEFNDNATCRMFYRGSSEQPSTSQLMPVPDNSNPLSIGFGNPTLTPYFRHDLRGDFRYSNKKKMSSFNIRFNGGFVQNPIVSALWYGTNGAQYTMPFNGPTSSNAGFRSFLNTPIGESDFSISNMLRADYSQSSSYVSSEAVPMDTYEDPAKGFYDFMTEFIEKDYLGAYFTTNTTTTVGFTERLRGTYRTDNLELTLSGRTRMNHSWYTISTLADETTTWNSQVSAGVNWTWDGPGITLKSDFNYNWYEGYSTEQPSEYVLNAEIQKFLLKKKMTLALKGYDILGQARNLTVTDASNYHQEAINNTLGRYVILSLTYRFGTFDASKMGGPGGHGGPGGPRR